MQNYRVENLQTFLKKYFDGIAARNDADAQALAEGGMPCAPTENESERTAEVTNELLETASEPFRDITGE